VLAPARGLFYSQDGMYPTISWMKRSRECPGWTVSSGFTDEMELGMSRWTVSDDFTDEKELGKTCSAAKKAGLVSRLFYLTRNYAS